MDVLAMVNDCAVARRQQPGQHLDRGAFSGTVGAEVAEDLSRLQREGNVLNRRRGPIELPESLGFEHAASFHVWTGCQHSFGEQG